MPILVDVRCRCSISKLCGHSASHAPTHAYVNGGGKVDHVGGLIVALDTGSPLSTHLPLGSASARKWAARKWASSTKKTLAPTCCASATRASYSATKASRLAASALSRRFLGRFSTNPRRCRACPRVDGGNSGNCSGSAPNRSGLAQIGASPSSSVAQVDAYLRRRFLYRRLQLGLLLSLQGGGNPQSAQKQAPTDRLLRKLPPTGRWYGHPAPTPRLPPLRSSPASITTMRATAPALGALAPR